MVRFLMNIAFSVAISNWVYDELVLFDATLKEPLDQITEMIRIPTHPDWFGGAGEKFFASMEVQLDELQDNLFDQEYLKREISKFL